MAETSTVCIWCPDRPEIPSGQFNEHVDRMHPSISDARNSAHCWSKAEVGTPDAVIREIACSRGRHRWGKHRNRHVRWACPRRCGCIRHARKRDEEPTP